MPRPRLELLSSDECKVVHEAALEILEEVGVLVDNEEALRLLREAGAEVDGRVCRMPQDLVESCVKSAPHSFTLYDRDGRPYAELGGDVVLYAPGSAATKFLEYSARRPRPSTLADLARVVAVAESLKSIRLQSTAVVPSDYPEELSDRIRLYPVLKLSRKPVVTGAFTIEGVHDMKRMLDVVLGDASRKPCAIFDVCPSPPLKWSRLTSQNLIDCARYGLPVEVIPMPILGATGPVTVAGSLVQHHAEALSGIVLAQLARKGTPVIYGGSPCLLDMRSGAPLISAPESLLVALAYVDLAKWLGLPCHAYMALGDSPLVDYQCGVESMVGATLAALKGVNVVSGPGMLGGENVFSLEKLVFDDDACGYALRMARGFGLGPEELAVEVIRSVGFRGAFLGHKHTLKHLRRELFFPRAFNRTGSPEHSALERARKEVEKILSSFEPPKLPPDVERELDRLVEDICRRFGAKLPKLPLTG